MKPNRIYHTWDKWECYPAGFYETGVKDKEDDACKREYAEFLRDSSEFGRALEEVISKWKNSCEHYLTNEKMNRIAWLGQASACLALGLPSKYRSGYFLLSDESRKKADLLALEYLNKWMTAHGYDEVTLEDAGVNAEVNIY